MKTDQLLDEVLMIIRAVKEDPTALQKILDYLNEEIVLPEEEENEVKIPERYNNAVKEIAGSIDAGLVCFLNTNTLQIDELPKELVASPAMYKMETGMSIKDFKPKYTRWKNTLP